ncbi:hypothetical protein JW960_14955 [candidate division KSB1 bacterium]|nr:hypothetical protein [candidate division KSB1 bacterium]
MYPCHTNKILPGRNSFSILWIISENTLYISIWILAGFLLVPVWQFAGISILTIVWAAIVISIQLALKKHNCSGCYYYDKRCHLGWGKISSALFEQDSGSPELAQKLSLFYIVSPPLIAIVSISYALVEKASIGFLGMIVLYIVLNAITFPVRRKGCAVCAMRATCPGSSVANS